VRNLSYAYPQNKGIETRSLLHNLCFQAGSGEWIMLSGDNGSGKSTLFFLIHGLLQPDAGCIEWNGTALDAYSPHQRLAVVGGVLQSPAFFDATVRENLTLFSPSPGETSIERALSYADAADTVAALPRGLDTRLQGGGANLSGGARQRLALARLFLNPPPLILLDEPFTALDSLSIQRVAEGMRNLASDRTLLLVHHGSSLPVSVDRTLNLQDGQIT
jgi:ABC-type bacteriocin/lantibiotic exporter with double-glycine peptidase domain